MLIALILLGILNFTLGAGYLALRSRKYDFPLWIYLLAVLFFWLPGAVFLLIFYRERRPDGSDRELYTKKITLGWLTALLPCLTLAGMSLLIRTQQLSTSGGEIPEICALAISFCLSCMLLVCVRFMEQAAKR